MSKSYTLDKTNHISIRLSNKTIKYLDMCATEKNMTRSEAIRDIIDKRLADEFKEYSNGVKNNE